MGSEKPRQFVVLQHILSACQHWDLMLEENEALATWQLPVPPEQIKNLPVTATRLADHRKAYLDYEGLISGDRGRVVRADAGTCLFLHQSEGDWLVELAGQTLRGRFQLTRQADGSSAWLLQRLRS